MQDLNLYIAIFASLAVALIGLIFLKSKSSDSSDDKKSQTRRRAAIPTRDEDGQIVGTGPGPRGRRGGGRMRRRQVQDEVEDEPQIEVENVEAGSDDEENTDIKAPSGKIGKKKMEKLQVSIRK